MSRRNKRDVDRYVSQIPEREISNRGYQIALLYYDAGEYEAAKRYLLSYISQKEGVPQAHKLMGQIMEASNNKEQAISSYRRSLELDSKQKDVVLKVCELYSTLKTVDTDRLKYWVEQAERFYPNSHLVFKLKERVMSGAKLEEMEDFYAKQLVKNYTDVNLHIKLLTLYLTEDKIGNAYRHTIDVEKTLAFVNSLAWYENIAQVFQEYQKWERCHSDTLFHTHQLIALCNLVYLQIKEKEIVTCVQSLHLLDQSLQEAMSVKSQKPEWIAVLSEIQGLFYFLCGLLLLKRASKGQLSWKDCSSFSVVCFLLSNHFPTINKTSSWYAQSKTVQLNKFYDRIYLFGCYRLSQVGYLVTSLLNGEAANQLRTLKEQLRSKQAKDKLYDIMFTMREMREKKDKSYLMCSDTFCSAQTVSPSKKLVAGNDTGVQELFADDLHQIVWLALQKVTLKDHIHPDYGLIVYNKFPFSTDNIDSSSLESLCQIDIQAFLIATVRCAGIHYEEQRRLGRKDQFRPFILPACLCQNLCTSQQTDWWTSMYKFCTGQTKDNFPKLRATIQRGLEVIRLQGTHGLSVVTAANIARTFDQRSKELEGVQTEEAKARLSGYNSRAAAYWTEVLNMLERIERKVSQRMPKDRLFDDGDHGIIDPKQIQIVKDQAIFSLATVAMRNGNYEEAKDKFEAIKTPQASYYLAKIYRDMSDQISSDDMGLAGEKVTLMERSLDTLYLTLDRLKDQKNHDLENIVPAEIDIVNDELEKLRMPGALVDSICNGMSMVAQPPDSEKDEDEASDEEYASFNTPQGKDEQPVQPIQLISSPSFVASTPMCKSKTPNKSSSQLRVSMELNQRPRPSPERLEARIWALEKKQETVIDLVQHLKNQNTELHQSVKDLKDEYGDLIKQMKDLILYQRQQQPPQNMYTSPYAGSLYRPPPPPPPPPTHYPYQPPPPMMSQAAYGYPMTMSPGPAGRPIPSRVSRVNQFTNQNDIDDDFYDGEFYEDDGSGQGMFGPDVSGWTVNHKPGFEGTTTMGYPGQPQQMPQAGFFAQALRGQALQFQQGQLLAGQNCKQGSPMMSSAVFSMSGTQPVTSGLFPSPGTQPVTSGLFPSPGTQPVRTGTVPGSVPFQNQTSQPGVQMPNRVPGGQLAELLASNSISPKSSVTGSKPSAMAKPADIQRPLFSTSQTNQVFGNVSSSVSATTTMPLLSSLVAASSSPEKPVTNPTVPAVNSVAAGPATPKGTFAFGQTQSATGTQSPFNFGQVSSAKPGTGLFVSPQKVSSTTSGTGTNLLPTQQKDKLNTGQPASKETSPVKSPFKSGEDHVEEYEPNVDFKPVIDLPDLVETKTGEEDEEVLFCERAKLFRFDDDQWKERGTGEMKLLRHKETKRVRVLMRRDQVLKVCANHFLTKEMKLAPLQSSKKAWCWNAQDFSEGEIQMEKLAIRFKDEDIAQNFKDTFEKLQDGLDKVVTKQPSESAKTATSDKPSFGSMFKKEEGSWSCNACLVSNKPTVQKCVACGTLKPGVNPEDVKQTETKAQSFSFGSSTGGFKIGGTAPGSGITFQPGGGFKFGQTTVADKNKPEVSKADSTTGSGLKFGGQTLTTTGTGTTTLENDPNKPPMSGGFKFGQQPQSDINKTDKGGFSFVTSTDKKAEGGQATPDSTKSSTFGGFVLGQTGKSSGFTFSGESKSTTSVETKGKPTTSFTFQSGAPASTLESKEKQSSFSFQPNAPVSSSTQGKSDMQKLPATFTLKPSSIGALSSTTTDTKDNSTPSFSFEPSAPLTSTSTQKGAESKSGAEKKDEKKGFGDLFKLKEGSWKCDGCLVSNNGDVLKCPACGTLKPGVTKEAAKAAGFSDNSSKKEEKKGFGDLFKPKEGSWKCDGCLVSNNGDILKCPACGTLKPGVRKEDLKESDKPSAFGSRTGGFSFGSKPGFTIGSLDQSSPKPSSFNFGTTSSESTKNKSEAKPTSGFIFTPTASVAEKLNTETSSEGFSFSMEPTATPVKGSGSFNFTLSPSKTGGAGPQSPPTNADGMYVNKEGEDDHIYFEPVIELPSMVEVVTGEEDDEVLFQHRAKLFRFVNNEWKERGLGDIKISKNKETGKVRLIMRREQILKICLNHYITKELELKPMPKSDDKAWVWYAMDFSENEPEMQQLAIKFKTKDIAANFKKVFDDVKNLIPESDSAEKTPVKSAADPVSKSASIKSTYDSDVVLIKEEKATDEQIKMARKFQLPDHFYLYERKPPCPGCIGCDDYVPGQKRSPKTKGAAKSEDNTSNSKANLFGQSSTSNLFQSTIETTKTGSQEATAVTEAKGGFFGGGATGGGGFSFADLAKQADSSPTSAFKVKDENKQFSWTGTGQKLFSSGGDHDDEGHDDDDDEGGATFDPQYEPIIDLPDLVDVQTGEEEYEKLFSQRAKLFRFDKATNQWKEKGVGEMKILQHKENKRYRLLLRREQVLKIACNQWLTPEISFKPMPTSETALCWVGQDFSDYEPVIEQLAVKFKTIQLVEQFKEMIEKCQEDMKQQKEEVVEKGDGDKIPLTVIAHPEEDAEEAAKAQQTQDQEHNEDDDDDNYTTEEEEEILFDKRIKFFSKEEDWKAVGLGTLKVKYDDDVNGNRIVVELDNNTVVCNHLVAKESTLSLNKKDCTWSPIDFSTDEPIKRHFRAQFSSEQAALEFEKLFQEGRELAVESDISERNMATYPREITFPVVHGGLSQ